MIRYISGPKKRKVERQISDCEGRIFFSKILMVLFGIGIAISCLYSADEFCYFFGLPFMIALIVFFINAAKLKPLEAELEEVQDDIEKDISVMTTDELLDDIVKHEIQRNQKS